MFLLDDSVRQNRSSNYTPTFLLGFKDLEPMLEAMMLRFFFEIKATFLLFFEMNTSLFRHAETQTRHSYQRTAEHILDWGAKK